MKNKAVVQLNRTVILSSLQQDEYLNVDTRLKIDFAMHSIAGLKTINEDACNAYIPESIHTLINKGVSLIIADGVSSAEAGKEASRYAADMFIEEYYKTPDTWSVKQAGQKTLSTINLNLFKKSHEFAQQEKGYLCTFSGVVVKSQTAYFFHAGDSRIYHITKNESDGPIIKQVTRDHSVSIGKSHNILSRAVGMDNILQIDFGKIEIKEGDILFLSTDGVHDFIDDKLIKTVLLSSEPLEQKSKQLINIATKNGSDDNISCIIGEVKQLPNESRDDFNTKLTRLPFPPDLSSGMKIDGFEVIKELFASSRSQVYLVKDTESGEQMVMKTPSITFQDDVHYIDRFIQEEWIGKRISSEYTVKIISQTRPRNFLYYLMEYVPGKSLDKWMKDNPLPSPKKAIGIVKQIAKALEAFHATETIHQDLKPANIMVDDNLNIKVIDFGSVFVAGIAEIFVPIEHQGALGTATYSDPFYIQGKNTGIQGDIYSLATITYELFTGHLPFTSKIEECVNANDFDKLRYCHADIHNPIIPIWFDRALQKGTSLQEAQRYRSLSEYISDITQPNPDFLKDDPNIQRSKGFMFWQVMSGFWVLLLLLVVILFSQAS